MKYDDVPLDANGYPFERPAFRLEPQEYGKIISEINTLYSSQYKDRQYCAHLSFGTDGVGYVYFFENHGFNNHNIYQRVVDNR